MNAAASNQMFAQQLPWHGSCSSHQRRNTSITARVKRAGGIMRNLLLAMAAVCVACGGGSNGSQQNNGANTVNGSVGGQSMSAKEAVSSVLPLTDSAGNPLGSMAVVLITNATGTCSMLGANQRPKNGESLALTFGGLTNAGVTVPTAPGSYPVYNTQSNPPTSAGNVAFVSFKAMDGTCTPTVNQEAVSGTLNIKKVDSSGYSGDFDLVFSGSTSHVTGSFISADCPAISSSHTTAPACI
jgi:hypothetical protein